MSRRPQPRQDSISRARPDATANQHRPRRGADTETRRGGANGKSAAATPSHGARGAKSAAAKAPSRGGRNAKSATARHRSRSAPGAAHDVAIDAARAREFGARLRRWFRANGRDLPWRRTRDAYHVLVSELMLQQTQVSRVVDYYERFLTRFPTLADVARAHPDHVLEAWEGLGYYARARNLHRLAHAVTDGGRSSDARLPADPAALRALPGIGAYTAGAVASFAYERRAALVDTNVARVLARAFAPGTDVKASRGARRVWEIARQLLPRGGATAWAHNQALMELGALVCTARVAHCGRCPVRALCATGSAGGAGGGARARGAPPKTNTSPRSARTTTAASRPASNTRGGRKAKSGPATARRTAR